MKGLIRLVQLEFLKLKSNKAMWWLLGLYVAAVILISFSGGIILEYMDSQGMLPKRFDPKIIPLYDFDDIWQNLAFLSYFFFKLFPAFLIVISISNEFAYKTHRQNIIDGLSRTEFFLSKMAFSAFLALLSGLLIVVLGFILGFSNSNIVDAGYIFGHIAFIPAHILQLFLFFLGAMFCALLIRKAGITIVLVLMYTTIVEPLAVVIVGHFYPELVTFFPLEAISNVVHAPFQKYILLETQTFISVIEVCKALGWGVVFSAGIYYQLKKRDF